MRGLVFTRRSNPLAEQSKHIVPCSVLLLLHMLVCRTIMCTLLQCVLDFRSPLLDPNRAGGAQRRGPGAEGGGRAARHGESLRPLAQGLHETRTFRVRPALFIPGACRYVVLPHCSLRHVSCIVRELYELGVVLCLALHAGVSCDPKSGSYEHRSLVNAAVDTFSLQCVH